MQIVTMPRLSLNEETSLLSEWYVKENDRVQAGDKLFSIETDKSTMDVEAPIDGVVLKRYYGDNEVVSVLAPVCAIGEPGEQPPEAEIKEQAAAPSDVHVESPKTPLPPAQHTVSAGAEFASPRAKRLIEQNGIRSLSGIAASGAEGRIIEEDVIAFLAGGAKPVEDGALDGRTVPFSKIRGIIARNMTASLQNSAQLTMSAVFNASWLQRVRAKLKEAGGEKQRVTIGDLIAYGTAKTLSSFPSINAWVGEDSYTEFDTVNLGIAVDTPRGLMVPTVFNAAKRSLLEISTEIRDLAAACREGGISPEKLKSGTFTISNLGALGIRTFTPILNPPQAAILGVGCIEYAIRQTDEGMLYYPACHLSLTVDHRAVDGAPAARFLKALCETLEGIEGYVQEELS